MMKWKMSKSWRKRKSKMKMKKMMVWMEEMGVEGIDRKGVSLPIRGGRGHQGSRR